MTSNELYEKSCGLTDIFAFTITLNNSNCEPHEKRQTKAYSDKSWKVFRERSIDKDFV